MDKNKKQKHKKYTNANICLSSWRGMGTHFFIHFGKGPWIGGRGWPGGPEHGQFVSAMGDVLRLAEVQGSQRFSVRALKGGQVFSPGAKQSWACCSQQSRGRVLAGNTAK